MGNVWLQRYSVLVLVSALLLVVAGALVTSNDAALSIPDWPLSYGKLIPPLEGGIRLEFAHRMLAATVAIFTLILAFWMQAAEPRPWLRRLGWTAFGTVVAQALLGGAAVKFVDPKPLAIAHACLAQICFGLLVAIAVARTLLKDDVGQVGNLRRVANPPSGLLSTHLADGAESSPGAKSVETSLDAADTSVRATTAVPVFAAAGLLLQTALGAAVRHNVTSVIPHIAGAAVSTALVMWAGLQVLIHHMEETQFRRPATLLLSLTFSQVLLGMGAYMSRVITTDAPQPASMMVAFTVAHVAAGSLAFGAAVALALVVYRDAGPANGVLAHGGMAVA